ncbi:HD domain-containing protein [Candidatus Aerophobetes bacterium]|uniref:HD domain-containing protein n=1 Tax=Aerophobetes bacterium TaxID=2030807 RepID=A0A523RWN6_UNCAE|nr:MAG: HD domain-containing protein [Candidatus Aerophobetes bacterium]
MTKLKQLELGKVEEKPSDNQAVILSLLEDAEEARRKVEEYSKTLEERVKKRTFELAVLYELSRKISYVLNYEELFRLICSSLTKVTDCPISGFLLLRENRAELTINLTRPIEDSIIQNFKKLLFTAFEKTSGQQIEEAQVKTRVTKNESFNAHSPRLKGEIKSFLNAPLIIKDKVRGILNISSPEGNTFTRENIRFFYTVANHASTCIDKLESLRQAEANKLRSMVESMSEGVIMVNGDGRVVVANPVAKKLLGVKDEDHPENNNLTELFKNSDLAELSEDGLLRSGNGKTRREIRITNPREAVLDTSISFIKDAQGTVIGKTIVLHDITKLRRAEEQLQQSFESLQKAIRETIQVVASTVEVRDPYTAGHQRRVTSLASAIAAEMGLSKDQIDGIRMAGMIHDLGKISVPAEILSKPGRITEREFDIIKSHSQVGHDILKTIEPPWPIAQIVLQHHERMDGSGYPQGLSGRDIMLEARILAVADVVEAMASHRPYRPALGIDKALEEISKKQRILYDPHVVDACLKLFTERRFQFE